MNKITRSKDLMIPKVTTGPISASTKVYTSPEGHDDVRVPFREIALSEGAAEKSFRVYDPSGPYTDAHATIDVEKGLPRIRAAWVRERGGVEEYVGRDIRPEDNGNVSGKHLARDFPNKPAPLRAISTREPSPQGGGYAHNRPQRRRLVGEIAGEVLARDVAVVLRLDIAANVFLDAAALAHPGGADAGQAFLDVDGGVSIGVRAGRIVDAEGFFGRAFAQRDLAERHAHVGVTLGRGVDLGAGADRPRGDLGDHQVFAAGDLVHGDLRFRGRKPCRKGSRPARRAPRRR